MKKTVSFILAAFTATVAAIVTAIFAAASAPLPFYDVEADGWSAPSVAYATEKGYMNGIGEGAFDPEGTLTRAAAAAVLWRRDGGPEPAEKSSFSDVEDCAWYSSAAAWGEQTGVTVGVSDTEFDPDGAVTREMLATMLYRFAEYKGLDVSSTKTAKTFPDSRDTSDYAAGAVSWAVGCGIILGKGSGGEDLLDPKGPATREQFAAILERFDGTRAANVYDILIDGGRLVKPFDPYGSDAYVQAIADEGREYVTVSAPSPCGVTATFDGAAADGAYAVDLSGKEYGYTGVDVRIYGVRGDVIRRFSLMILKPADDAVLYGLYNRPRFHYTPPYGYMNDPNGLLYNAATGEYHLFYQAYPYSTDSVLKHWGHAVTRDLFTFEEMPTALYPDEDGYAMWSGSGIIDYNNDAGLYDETTPPEARMVLVYYLYRDDETDAGLAYTEDGGATWIKARGGERLNFYGSYPSHYDPKVFFSEEFKKWVMICASGETYTSTDLWNWKFSSKDTAGECPDIFRMKVEETGEMKYVRSYGGTFYRVGDPCADGRGRVSFVSESGDLTLNGDRLDRAESAADLASYGWFSGRTGSFYATQHFSDAPDGRIVAVSWLIEKGLDATGTWAGALTAAQELKLHVRDGRYYLTACPVEELSALRGDVLFSCENTAISPDVDDVLGGVSASYADIDGVFVPGEGVEEFGFRLREGDGGYITVRYDVESEALVADYSNSGDGRYVGVRRMDLPLPADGRISLRILLDSIIVESFGNRGEAAISSVFSRPAGCDGMTFFSSGGTTVIENLTVYEMLPAR